MTSKKSASKSKKEPDKKQPEKKAKVNPPVQESEYEENEETDYGGLPRRDLKKNLGCG